MKQEIQIANTDEQISRCYPVMQELRPHIPADQFLQRIRKQQESGYVLASIENTVAGINTAVAVAGFRINENLAWGHFLYVDDLVTSTNFRSHGYGTQLLDWLKAYAQQQGCGQLHLDSGVQRLDAHRFYEREGIPKSSFHFSTEL